MFMFTLAQDLHMTVGELSEKMTSEEFTYWMAFYDYRNQQIKSSKKNGKIGIS